MTSWEPTRRVSIGAVTIELPAALLPAGHAIDSAAGHFVAEGLSVLVDQGPFANPLTSAVGLPEYEETTEEVAGLPARRISHRQPDGSGCTLGVHVPGLNRLTVVVEASGSVPRQVAARIIGSIEKTTADNERK